MQMSKRKDLITKTLEKALEHAAARQGNCCEMEFRAIDAEELIAALNCEALMQRPVESLSGVERERAEAILIVCTMHAEERPYKVIVAAIKRVLAGLNRARNARAAAEATIDENLEALAS
jgi:ABC-type lipopolysaccharide export system ATPase subunit